MDPFIGQVLMFGGNFAPRGWAFCHGQLLPISQNTALFSLIGTIYGGDGRTTFALPDLRGRAPIGPGTGPGLPTYREGQRGGQERVTLNTLQMPAHSHSLASGTVSIPVSEDDADQDEANGKYLANGNFYHNEQGGIYGNAPIPLAGTTANAGNNQAVENMAPFLAVNYIIALFGTFPSRN